MRDVAIPDLTFPMVAYGRIETQWDLRVLLYKGGAKGHPRNVLNRIAEGKLGHPLVERITLVTRIHEELTAKLVGGGARESAYRCIRHLRRFVAWADQFNQPVSLESIEDTYRHWCDALQQRALLKHIKLLSAYSTASAVSSTLDAALERSQPLILTTRLRSPKRAKRAVSRAADKQSLTATFAFGQLCLDIIDSLPYEAVFGSLPVRIRLRDGRELEQWSALKTPTKVTCLQPGYRNEKRTRKVVQKRANWEADRTLRTRFPLVNLRLLAEMMVFIGQTGINTSQAKTLKLTQYSYKSTIDGFEVRDYKARRKGEVLFEIYSGYKAVFEAYLEWRKKVFGTSSDLLFPFVRRHGALATAQINYEPIRDDICKPLGITFVSSQVLRNTRVNWLLRRSRDPDLTAEMAQHTKEVLLNIYEKPSQQVAEVEIIQFWQKNDPRLGGSLMACPAPGSCDGVPQSQPGLPPEVPKPDCINPSGCLFCTHHRDIDSEDYVWATASMRHLTTIVLSRFRPPSKSKTDSAGHVQMVIDVLTAKLQWFRESNATRKAWVDESLEKLVEGDYHVYWRYLIESAEGL